MIPYLILRDIHIFEPVGPNPGPNMKSVKTISEPCWGTLQGDIYLSSAHRGRREFITASAHISTWFYLCFHSFLEESSFGALLTIKNAKNKNRTWRESVRHEKNVVCLIVYWYGSKLINYCMYAVLVDALFLSLEYIIYVCFKSNYRSSLQAAIKWKC